MFATRSLNVLAVYLGRLDARTVTVALTGGLLWGIGILGGCGYDTSSARDGRELNDYPALTVSQRAVLGGAYAEGPAAFGIVAGAALHRDSLLAVSDGHSRQIQVFDLDGHHLRSLAGEGVGPGLARAIRFLSFTAGGGICMWDQELGRITHFDHTGTVIETWSPSHDRFSLVSSRVVGMADDCSSAVFRDPISPDLAIDTTDRAMIQTVDTIIHSAVERDGAARELSRRPAPPVWVLRTDRLNTKHAVVLGERLESAIVGMDLWIGVSDSLRWQRIDPVGRELSPVHLPTERRPTTALDIEQERAKLRGEPPPAHRFLSPNDVRRVRAAWDRGQTEVPASEFLPAYDVMIAGSDRTLWVREASPYSADLDHWILLKADGTSLGRLSLPKGGEVVAASSRVIVIKNQDEFGAHYLQVLEIRPDPRG